MEGVYGAELLGIPKNKMFEALKGERHEIDHYGVCKGSLSDYLSVRTDKKANYVNWYFVFVLELAVRIALLEKIGCKYSAEQKIYALNEINDWIILGCDIEEEWKNPKNVMKQMLQRNGIFMR